MPTVPTFAECIHSHINVLGLLISFSSSFLHVSTLCLCMCLDRSIWPTVADKSFEYILSKSMALLFNTSIPTSRMILCMVLSITSSVVLPDRLKVH